MCEASEGVINGRSALLQEGKVVARSKSLEEYASTVILDVHKLQDFGSMLVYGTQLHCLSFAVQYPLCGKHYLREFHGLNLRPVVRVQNEELNGQDVSWTDLVCSALY